VGPLMVIPGNSRGAAREGVPASREASTAAAIIPLV